MMKTWSESTFDTIEVGNLIESNAKIDVVTSVERSGGHITLHLANNRPAVGLSDANIEVYR